MGFMKSIKKISTMLLIAITPLITTNLHSMERPGESKPIAEYFDLSEPYKLLQSIKRLQETTIDSLIELSLRERLRFDGKNLDQITSLSNTILDYLDDTCTAYIVEIILGAFGKGEDACRFIMRSAGHICPLEKMLRTNNFECALPMIKLLSKNKAQIIIHKHKLFGGLKAKIFYIDDMVKNASVTLGKDVFSEAVLLAVAQKLQKQLSANPLDSNCWFKLYESISEL